MNAKFCSWGPDCPEIMHCSWGLMLHWRAWFCSWGPYFEVVGPIFRNFFTQGTFCRQFSDKVKLPTCTSAKVSESYYPSHFGHPNTIHLRCITCRLCYLSHIAVKGFDNQPNGVVFSRYRVAAYLNTVTWWASNSSWLSFFLFLHAFR